MEKQFNTTTGNVNPNKANPNKFDTSKHKKEDKESLTHKAGDAIERVGEKVIKAGAPKIGKAIYNAGDKLEHINDNKNKPL